MKIIKEVNQEYKHKCKYCKSIYVYDIKDIYYGLKAYVKCPVCKNRSTTSIFDRKVK